MYKTVLVGCGNMSRVWMEYVMSRDDVKIVGLVDVNAANAERLNSSFYTNAKVYTDYKLAINEENPDLVLNVTPPDYHFDVISYALESGCHVFTEKSLVHKPELIDRIIKIADDSGMTLAIMQNRRYSKGIRSFKSMVKSNIIGNKGFICADYFMGRINLKGHNERLEHPLLVDMAIHTFDEARFITGYDALSVSCNTFKHPGTDFNGYDSAVCLFEMSDGSYFSYRGSWAVSGYNTPSFAQWRVTGENGTILWDGENLPTAELRGTEIDTYISVSNSILGEDIYNGQDMHYGCLDEMFDALSSNRDPETVYYDNVKSLKMVFAAIESADAGGEKIIIK